MLQGNLKSTALICFHCGDQCNSSEINIGNKLFCCNGCKIVYEILTENKLNDYYKLNLTPGSSQRNRAEHGKFRFLDDVNIVNKLVHFTDEKRTHITFHLPQIHCSSCLYLLENLNTFNEGIINSIVNYSRKEIFIVYDNASTNFRKVVESLARIGYEPQFNLADLSQKPIPPVNRKRWYKIGVAGFCYANINMMALTDYLANQDSVDVKISALFRVVSLILAIPVLVYAASEFFQTAWAGLKNKFLNIDFLVVTAILITFFRSLYDITLGIGGGYLDSMTGIVFFMLLGRWLQHRTYSSVAYDRDYKSFLPISIDVIKNGKISPVEVSQIAIDDVICIHNNEVIPVDAILQKGKAYIDYSYVTGEFTPQRVGIGERIYAGGRQTAGNIELSVIKKIDQTYLNNLWNNNTFDNKEKLVRTAIDKLASGFTYVVLLIGLISGLYWYLNGSSINMWNAITTVLIIACPCALLLAGNFTYGNLLRKFGTNKLYLKSHDVIEKMADIDHIVFDKTGTLTQTSGCEVSYIGKRLNTEEQIMIASLLSQSNHPAAKAVSHFLKDYIKIDVKDMIEREGLGMEAWIDEQHVKLGSEKFINGKDEHKKSGSEILVEIDGVLLGKFTISNKYRIGIKRLISLLRQEYKLSVLSGDNDSERQNLRAFVGEDNDILFDKNPKEKLIYIDQLQKAGHKVMMLGDGLNDAGAFKQSDIGIAVSDNSNAFTPASDGIIAAGAINRLLDFIHLAKAGKKIILTSFIVSIVYNVIGLFFAVQGNLSPVVAAILMPCSSITVVALTYFLTEWQCRKNNLCV